MIPLSYVSPKEENIIRKVGGSPEIKKTSGKSGICGWCFRNGHYGIKRKRDRESQRIPGSNQ